MRTIKFRGKCCHCDAWAYGNLVDYGEDECPEIQGFDVYNEGSDVWQEPTVELDTIGQFTGLYDKYGKEIYEGDIIQHRGQKVIVEFYRGAYGYGRIVAGEHVFVPFIGSDNNKDALQFPDGTYFDTDFCEVIGNIHSDPKLLEQ